MTSDSGPFDIGRKIGWREVLSFVCAALLIRIYKGLVTPIMAEDGVAYLEQAALFRAGEFAAALRGHYPPLYPALVGLAQMLIPHPVAAGKAVSAIAGSLGVIPLVILGRTVFPRPAVRAAVIIYILCPFPLSFSGDVLTESLFLLLVLSALACLWRSTASCRPAAAAMAGLFVGLAAVTKPEGVILIPFGIGMLWFLGGRRDSGRGRIARLLLFTALLSAPLVPYSFVISKDTGHWIFTRKGPELLSGLTRYASEKEVALTGLSRSRYEDGPALSVGESIHVVLQNRALFVRKYLRDLGLLLVKSFPHVIHPIGLGLLLAGILLRGAPRGTAWCLLGFVIWDLLCIAITYPNPRFLISAAGPAILWAGMGTEEIRLRLVKRWPESSALIAWTLLGLIAAGLAARAIQPERLDKLWLRDAGGVIQSAEERPVVCSRWKRLAYYAGGEHLALPRGGYDDILRACRDRGATHLGMARNEATKWFYPNVKPEDLAPIFGNESVTVFRLRYREEAGSNKH